MPKDFKTSREGLIKMQVVHLGKILFNLQFVALVILIACSVSFLVPAAYYLALICITFLTLFTLLANPTFMSFWSGGETLLKIANTLSQSWKYLVPITIVLAVGSIVCLCLGSLGKNKNNVPRIVVSAIVCAIAIVALIILAN